MSNSTGASDSTLGHFAAGDWWRGLASYINDRETRLQAALAGDVGWDEVNKMRGEIRSLQVLKRLETDAETFVAAYAGTKKSEKN